VINGWNNHGPRFTISLEAQHPKIFSYPQAEPADYPSDSTCYGATLHSALAKKASP
jgi:hypothetical protein